MALILLFLQESVNVSILSFDTINVDKYVSIQIEAQERGPGNKRFKKQ